MRNPIRSAGAAIGRMYCRNWCRVEYADQPRDPVLNERPVEYNFVFRAIRRRYPRRVLDVGSGVGSLPHIMFYCGCHVTAVDNITSYWPGGTLNRHYHVIDDDITNSKLTGPFDLITCVSVLEHIRRAADAVRSMRRLLSPSGCLVLTFPYCEDRYVENVYALEGVSYGQDNPYPCQVFSRRLLDEWTGQLDLEIVEQEYWRIFAGEFWAFGDRLSPPVQVDRGDPHHLTCVLMEPR